MSFIKRHGALFSTSAIYLVTNVINSALPFLLLPILTTYLQPEEFGRLGIFQGLYTALLALVGIGINGAIVRKSYELGGRELGVYIFNSILIMLCSLTIFTLAATLLEAPITYYLELPLIWVVYCLILAAAMFLINCVLGQLQVNQKPKIYGAFQICHSALNLSLSLLFVITLSAGAQGRILGILFSALAFGAISAFTLFKKNKLIPQFNKTYIEDALRFGLPLVPHELGTFFITWFSMFVINHTLEASSVGIYLFAFQLSMVLGVCADAFNKAYVPWLYSQLNQKDSIKNNSIIHLTYLYFATMMLISILCFTFGPMIIKVFFDERYASAGTIIGWLVLGQAFGGMYLMVTNYIFYSKRTGVLSGITLASSLLAIALSFLLIRPLGITGAAITFTITRFTMFALTWLVAAKLVPMPWLQFKGR